MWKDLTMAQKSELMKIFIKSGITSTSEMASIYDKNHSTGYNSFATGGNLFYNGGDKEKVRKAVQDKNAYTKYNIAKQSWDENDILYEMQLPPLSITADSPETEANKRVLLNHGYTQEDLENPNIKANLPALANMLRNYDINGINYLKGIGTVGLGLAGILGAGPAVKGIKALDAAVRGTKLGGMAYNVMTNPLVEGAMTLHGLVDGYDNVKEGIQNIKDEEYLKGISKIGLTGLETVGATDAIIRAGRIANPLYRAKHAYNTISPSSYSNIRDRSKDWFNSMWRNENVNIDNPLWRRKAIEANITDKTLIGYPNLTGNPDRAALIDNARQDAWAIYNHLPQPHNTYIKRDDGTYYYDLDKVMSTSKGEWNPAGFYINNNPRFDHVTTSGGGLQDLRFLPYDNNQHIIYIKDDWDLHPFSRVGDKLSNKLNNVVQEREVGLRNTAQKFREFMYDKGIWGINGKIKHSKLDRSLNRFRVGDTESLRHKVENKIVNSTIAKNALSKLDKALTNFEVGSVSGGTPFTMSTYLPTTILPNQNGVSYLFGFNRNTNNITGSSYLGTPEYLDDINLYHQINKEFPSLINK